MNVPIEKSINFYGDPHGGSFRSLWPSQKPLRGPLTALGNARSLQNITRKGPIRGPLTSCWECRDPVWVLTRNCYELSFMGQFYGYDKHGFGAGTLILCDSWRIGKDTKEKGSGKGGGLPPPRNPSFVVGL